jgi:hypothetical protein
MDMPKVLYTSSQKQYILKPGNTKHIAIVLITLLFFSSGFAQNVPPRNPQRPIPQNPPKIKEAVESDWSNPTGPYKVVMELDETLPDHTVYRPANLNRFPEKDKLPVVTFNVPVFMAVREIEGDAHGGTFREKNGGGFGVAGAAWVMWNMKDDQKAALMFKGDPCGLAEDTAWIEIRKKNID